MKTEIKIEITFENILDIVKRLPRNQKMQLTKELEKEVIESKLSSLLKIFKTKDIDLKTIYEESQIVRRAIYAKQKN